MYMHMYIIQVDSLHVHVYTCTCYCHSVKFCSRWGRWLQSWLPSSSHPGPLELHGGTMQCNTMYIQMHVYNALYSTMQCNTMYTYMYIKYMYVHAGWTYRCICTYTVHYTVYIQVYTLYDVHLCIIEVAPSELFSWCIHTCTMYMYACTYTGFQSCRHQ